MPSFENGQTCLLAFSFGQKTILLGLLVFAFVAYKTTEDLLVCLIYVNSLTFITFGVEIGIKKNSFMDCQ